jgi:hypothetical protein
LILPGQPNHVYFHHASIFWRCLRTFESAAKIDGANECNIPEHLFLLQLGMSVVIIFGFENGGTTFSGPHRSVFKTEVYVQLGCDSRRYRALWLS